MGLIQPRNDVFNINPPAGARHLSAAGSDWLWAVTAIYLLSFIACVALSFRPRNGERIFHYLFAIALLVGGISYFAMAGDLAFRVVPTEFERHSEPSYQIFWAKYVNWVVTFPLMSIVLGLVSGTSWATIIYNVGLSWIWVITYLCAAFTRTSYKWGFFTFGTIAWLVLAYQTLWVGFTSAKRFNVSRDYLVLAGWLNLLWLLYPIAFGVSDGGNTISVTNSFVFFGILDVLLAPVLAFGVLFFARGWDYGALNLHFTQYGRVMQTGGTFPEKQAHAPAATPATATPATAAPAEEGVVADV